ncbi:hypothetical protein PR048_024208 [Dryococelus australis]|uniref:Uncharacterized protein n=1 Tax=Dryococelus australis TaxID=614101 RepID=A0ABQ9GW88_9NEOP|nr:hypothetical protein PR048_024208 [Dryococelus australis]
MLLPYVKRVHGRAFITSCTSTSVHESGALSLWCNLPDLVKVSLHEAEEYPGSRTLAGLQTRPKIPCINYRWTNGLPGLGGVIWVVLNIEVFRANADETRCVWSNAGMQGQGIRESPEKTCQPAARPAGFPCSKIRREWNPSRGGVVVRLLTSHLSEPRSIPSGSLACGNRAGRCHPVGRRVLSGISRFPRPCIPALLRTGLASPSSALNTSMSPYAQARAAPQPVGSIVAAPQPVGSIVAAPQPVGSIVAAPQPVGSIVAAPQQVEPCCRDSGVAYVRRNGEYKYRAENLLTFLNFLSCQGSSAVCVGRQCWEFTALQQKCVNDGEVLPRGEGALKATLPLASSPPPPLSASHALTRIGTQNIPHRRTAAYQLTALREVGLVVSYNRKDGEAGRERQWMKGVWRLRSTHTLGKLKSVLRAAPEAGVSQFRFIVFSSK